ncbi:carbonic anhydrase [Blastopirellula retiformator]|uniref:Carbonic anhydrase n=1 Tax=Blastopirellula retiformator TaxID=2527970 RepID=A0A5C5V925_9BACT|nr:carbonic anhydrase [Blastopirellula retiformator]TWT34781.1 Carbonic anhydrase 1 [Blastopirellula retiformator]
MQKLVQGIRQFQQTEYSRKESLFAELATGQAPPTMFITCSDSRVDPNLITGSDPGDLFVLRNAGNMIPYQDAASGEVATIEYAVQALNVQHIVVCGHSQCGAMKATLDPASCNSLPSVAEWLKNSKDVVQRTTRRHGEQSPERMLELVIQENVRMQLENLQSLEFVAAALAEGRLQLHGWTYDIGKGAVESLQPEPNEFVSVFDAGQYQVDESTAGLS